MEARLMKRWNTGILVFDGVEVLDFAGPYEVFSRTRTAGGLESRRSDETAPFRVFTVAKSPDPVAATGGLRVVPDHSFASAPKIDLIVVPGGFGVRPLLEDGKTLAWIQAVSVSAELVTSVCTGSAVLARAGLLAGKRATTHWSAFALLRAQDATVAIDESARFVENPAADGMPAIVTSAGVSAGIDMAFHVVETLCGRAVADETARYIDYPRHRADRPGSNP
jgi:transcriptional regulator GlxA family with amidase domain